MDSPPVQYVKTSDGYDIAYCEAGSGRPLIFMPPAFTSVQTVWRQFPEWMEGLSQRFQLIVFDRRGSGLSTRGLPENAGRDSWLPDLHAVAGLLGGERCLLFVVADSGHHAVRFALSAPGILDGLIWSLASMTLDVWPPGLWATLPRENWQAFLSSIVPSYVTPDERPRIVREYREWTTLEDWNAGQNALRDSSVEEELPRLRVPLLVLHQEDFFMFPDSESRKVAAAVPGAKFSLLKGGEVLGDPAQGLATIDAFVAGLPSPDEQAPARELPGALSDRELEVLRFLAQGKTNPQIAEALVITRSTVQNHVSNILIKLNLQNRAQAAVYAQQHGIV
jgi:DNA-binding CsgD family transcriptional regulator/pimeloyl-ACP methyl ester carboxylesterase